MEKIILSPRLSLIANMVQKDAVVADVGTDHGHMTVWLLQNNIAKYVYATDIHALPLARAAANIRECGLADKAETVLCDGVSKLEPNSVDTIIVAGMGGETMISILEAVPWTRDNVQIILQPQSKLPDLRYWLCDNGYEIKSENIIIDAGKTYPVMLVTGGAMQKPSPAQSFIGELGLHKSPELLSAYITATIAKLERIMTAISVSNKEVDKARVVEYKDAIAGLIEMKRGMNDD